MRILLTNDDGIEAPGLAALEQALAPWGELLVVAPKNGLSGCSHQATTDRPLEMIQTADRQYAVDGTPADCVRLGLLHVASDVDWVVAGINDGANLGVDVYMSGTVAAVREAALFGKPAVAFSQYRIGRDAVDWDNAAHMTRAVFDDLHQQPVVAHSYWNVNFPAQCDGEVPERVRCPLDPHALPLHYERSENQFVYRSNYQSRKQHPHADVHVCFSGRIAVTQLTVLP